MQTDVKSVNYTGVTAIIYEGPTRLKGIVFSSDGTAGNLTFRDGGSTGAILFKLSLPAVINSPLNIQIPGEGIKFNTNIYTVLPSAGASSVTIFYG